MTVDLVPSTDLVPSLPSRIVTVNVTDAQEGEWASDQSIHFRIVGDVHVAADKRIVLGHDGVRLPLPEGRGQVRLPVWTEATGEWAIEVAPSWTPHPYYIRVPAGTGSIDLSQINPLHPVDQAIAQWLLTNASITASEGAAWDASVSVAGGNAHFDFTFPPGGTAYWRGGTGLPSGADIYSLETGVYSVWERPRATELGLPTETQGILEVFRYGAAGGILRWTTRQVDAPSQVWQTQAFSSTSWDDWTRVDVGATYNYWRGGTPLAVGSDIYSLETGVYSVWNRTIAIGLGLPTDTQGILEVFRYGSSGGILRWTTRQVGSPVEIWQTQSFSSSTWDEWHRVDAGASTPPSPTTGGVSPSGFKRVPIAVTLGNGGGSDAPTSAAVRYAIHFNAPITRWRLHVANRNARSGDTRPGTIAFTDWRIGTEQSGGTLGDEQTIIDGFTTDGSGWVSKWLHAPIDGDIPRLLATTYTATAAPYLQVGACWRGTDEANLSQHTTAPFEVWIEAETPARTGAVAVIGSSSDAGVGGARPVVDSTISAWCRAHGALPVHYAHSGDAMSASLDPDAYKWSRWQSLDRPDAALIALGSNDVYSGALLADLQDRHSQLAAIATTMISPTLYGATVFQRANAEAPNRDAYNAWLLTQPNGLRDVYDFADAIGSPPDPAYDADGVHLNNAGQAALLATITRPLTTTSSLATPVKYLGDGVYSIGGV